MEKRRNNTGIAIAIGCALLLLCIVGSVALVSAVLPAFRAADVFEDVPFGFEEATVEAVESVGVTRIVPEQAEVDVPAVRATQGAIPTLPASAREETAEQGLDEEVGETTFQPGVTQPIPPFDGDYLTELYRALNPGVVSIRVFAQSPMGLGEGAGSGFIIDDQGHIVTNDHVVQGAEVVRVIFYDGFEAEAQVVGSDDDSDLAVLRVDDMPDNAHALPIGDSNSVEAGEWVVAIGNPFGFDSSMTLGIVSAVGRAIPGLAPQFSIPQVIQTDAPINPGNSGGPLLNMRGEVIGVNAQIRNAEGIRANAGVGFAIPSNVVRLVAPVLIEQSRYQWPYLGVSGPEYGVDLALQRANDLPDQSGAYVHFVQPGTPAEQAGLQGSSGERTVLGQAAPTGGDVIVAFNGEPIADFADMLSRIAFSQVGEEVVLTVRRGGETVDVPVTLAARPDAIQTVP